MKNKAVYLLLLAGILASCTPSGKTDVSSSSAGSESSESSDSASSGGSSFEYATIEDAFENSQEYAVGTSNPSAGEQYFEINLSDLYYYAPSVEGYIALPEDPGYYHAFVVGSDNDGHYEMDVQGRRGLMTRFSSVRSTRLIDILGTYLDDFSEKEPGLYSCSVSELGDTLSFYLQSSGVKYANYFELSIREDGKFGGLTLFEQSSEGTYPISELAFSYISISDYLPYARWNDAGRKINLMILDLKMGAYSSFGDYSSLYEGESVSIEGIVSLVDNGSYYVAQENQIYGNVGIKVVPKDKDSIPQEKDVVTVTGKIKTEGFVSVLGDAVFTESGEPAPYAPIFDEETIVDVYGGGAYAANLFSQGPYYAGSIYSGFAYGSTSFKDNGGEETAELICPLVESPSTGSSFKMQIVLPSSLSTSKKEELKSSYEALGLFNDETNFGNEGSFSEFIVGFDPSYADGVVLIAGESSSIGPRLDFQGKVEAMFGYDDFPIPGGSSTSYATYRFGGSTMVYLESLYGLDSHPTTGVYIQASPVTATEFDNYIGAITSEGFELVDEFKGANSARHSIYSDGNLILDLKKSEAIFDYSNYTVEIYLYQGNIVHGKTIEEQVEDAVSEFFPSGDFIRLAGTHDADYSHFALLNFAGRDFSEDSPLHCFTVDLSYDAKIDFAEAYRAEGYSYVRGDDMRLYEYATRGSKHYVLYKDAGNGENYYVDIASYPTSDYTYAGHADFAYRTEIMLYKGTEPLSTIYEPDLSSFMDAVVRNGDEARFDVVLPAEAKVEYLNPTYDYTFLEYGYYNEPECFVYANDISSLQKAFEEALVAAGYSKVATGSQSVTYAKEIDPETYNTSYIVLMPKESRGCLRILNGVPGIDF